MDRTADSPEHVPSVAVVGGGISGLTTALRLLTARDSASQDSASQGLAPAGVQVTVYESTPRLGGCLSRTELGGLLPGGADEGAEASLHRRPETRELMEELGLTPVHPSTAHGSRILTDHGLRAIPRGTLMGVPGDPRALAEVLSPEGVARVAEETLTPPQDGDVSCGGFLASRLGDEVVDTLIDPLIGGVYAGRCRELSLAATVPALLPAAQQGTPVLETVREVLASRAQTQGASIPGASGGNGQPPVFCSLRGGISGLIPALADRLTALGACIRTGTGVREIRAGRPSGEARPAVRTQAGWEQYDHVVLAVPAWAAAGLLREADPRTAELLSGIGYASSAVITAVLDDAGTDALSGSGYLVPPVRGSLVKASTFSSNKWPWLAAELPAGRHVVRMSVGRLGDTAWQQCDDAALIEAALAEWREATGQEAAVVHAEVRRWERALPQYAPGHAELAAALTASTSAGLSLAGSYLEGVGIPACISRARATAQRVLADLSSTILTKEHA
ncbi:protoporphyrinogen oxidase [Brevibacterium sp.]|uniref:protoporphyrinogen oxidase n=1 Tax=Brevibacterium sp. TaxID=1701 RepID=UPI0025C3DA27|nr:protoporphyrinogen oxidase [Brevibacterium sp.]